MWGAQERTEVKVISFLLDLLWKRMAKAESGASGFTRLLLSSFPSFLLGNLSS